MPLSEKSDHRLYWTCPARLASVVSQRDLVTLRAMADHGAELNLAVDTDTLSTIMHFGARQDDVALVEFLIGHGVDIDPVNARGDTPLHLAVESAGLPLVRFLVELGADFNATNNKGDSPLMVVCRRGGADIARYLVEMRADLQARTKLGDSPLEVAQRLGHQDTVMALCMTGAPLRSGTPLRSSSRGRTNSPMHVHGRLPPGLVKTENVTEYVAGSLAGRSSFGSLGGYPSRSRAAKLPLRCRSTNSARN